MVAYAVVSNHLHLVLHVDPTVTMTWADQEVEQRWVSLFPPRANSDEARIIKQNRPIANPVQLELCRARFCCSAITLAFSDELHPQKKDKPVLQQALDRYTAP